MSNFTNKIDFVAFAVVRNANPNGDPLNGNRPRENYDGYGEISDVCLKRKIRNRLQDMGEKIFVQSDERCDDGKNSLSDRAKENKKIAEAMKAKDKELYAKVACEEWIDVRSFGQVFAFKDAEKSGVSVGVRGPVSIHSAVSLSPIDIHTMQITKSVNSETKDKKSSDTMGSKHSVSFAVYEIKGSINHQLATKTGFSDEDAEKMKEAIRTLFENDASSARPDGSMEIKRLYWFKHNCPNGQYSSAKVHQSVNIVTNKENPKAFEDYDITLIPLEGLEVEIIED